jgi:hypothetical protein
MKQHPPRQRLSSNADAVRKLRLRPISKSPEPTDPEPTAPHADPISSLIPHHRARIPFPWFAENYPSTAHNEDKSLEKGRPPQAEAHTPKPGSSPGQARQFSGVQTEWCEENHPKLRKASRNSFAI